MKKILFFLIIPFLSFGQQLNTENIFYDGHNREYIIYVPENYSNSNSVPILLALHGGSGYAVDFMNYEADFRSIADTSGFILIYPQALEDPETGYTSWLHKEPTEHDDIFFIEAIIDDVSLNYNIDQQRIYACGYSLGGMFSYDLACRLNSRIAAISSVAGAAFVGAFYNCNLVHPTAVQSIVGTNDDIHPYNDINGLYYPVSEINNYWSTFNNTDINPVIESLPDLNSFDGSTVERYLWMNGDGCVSVEELKIINGGHDWPSPLASWGNQDINANVEVWNFVSKFNMNGLIGCNTTNYLEVDHKTLKNLITIIGVLGRETNNHKGFQLQIYDDGSVEKKYTIK